jgi:hypothetical protein
MRPRLDSMSFRYLVVGGLGRSTHLREAGKLPEAPGQLREDASQASSPAIVVGDFPRSLKPRLCSLTSSSRDDERSRDVAPSLSRALPLYSRIPPARSWRVCLALHHKAERGVNAR